MPKIKHYMRKYIFYSEIDIGKKILTKCILLELYIYSRHYSISFYIYNIHKE